MNEDQNRIAVALEKLFQQNDEHEEAERRERFDRERGKDYGNTIGFPDRGHKPWWKR